MEVPEVILLDPWSCPKSQNISMNVSMFPTYIVQSHLGKLMVSLFIVHCSLFIIHIVFNGRNVLISSTNIVGGWSYTGDTDALCC